MARYANFGFEGASTCAIVERLQVLEDGAPCGLPGGKGPTVDELTFERGHERFGDGVVQGRSRPSHRGDDACLLQALAERERRVLSPTIGMVDEPCGRFPSAHSHLQSIDHELAVR